MSSVAPAFESPVKRTDELLNATMIIYNGVVNGSVMYLEHFYDGEAVVFKGMCTTPVNILKMRS